MTTAAEAVVLTERTVATEDGRGPSLPVRRTLCDSLLARRRMEVPDFSKSVFARRGRSSDAIKCVCYVLSRP